MTPVRMVSRLVLGLLLASAPALRAADAPAQATPAPTVSSSGLATTQGKPEPRDPVEVAADALVARPAGLAATVVGAAIFVVALPFAAITGDVNETGKALVGAPAKFTFQRRLGEFTMH